VSANINNILKHSLFKKTFSSAPGFRLDFSLTIAAIA
jgi:hypothetical protein